MLPLFLRCPPSEPRATLAMLLAGDLGLFFLGAGEDPYKSIRSALLMARASKHYA